MVNMYENTCIGNFIYILGIETGQRFNKNNADQIKYTSINLYQQTPLDPKLGDILAKWNGAYFLLEFKRNKKEVVEEKTKSTKKKVIKKLRNEPDFAALSRKCHFITYPHESFADSPEVMFFTPYINSIESVDHYEQMYCLKRFLNGIFASTPEFGATKEEFQKYIDGLDIEPWESMEGIIFAFEEGNPPKMHHFRDFNEFIGKDSSKKKLSDFDYYTIKEAKPKQLGPAPTKKK